jgi:hypothetical protein
MAYDPLVIEYDEEGRWVTFRKRLEPAERMGAASFQPRKGFSLADVLEAVRATTWVAQRDGALVVEPSVTCAALAEVVAEMMLYFAEPAVPSERLLRIQKQVDAVLAERDVTPKLGLWSYAWLDVIVHADVADAALAAEDVWTRETLTLDLRRSRERRLDELLQREKSGKPSEAAMAPSGRSRRAGSERGQQAG